MVLSSIKLILLQFFLTTFSPLPLFTCQLSVGRLLTASCPPLSPTVRRVILSVQVWSNVFVDVLIL